MPSGCCCSALGVCGDAVVFRCSRDIFTIFSIGRVKYVCTPSIGPGPRPGTAASGLVRLIPPRPGFGPNPRGSDGIAPPGVGRSLVSARCVRFRVSAHPFFLLLDSSDLAGPSPLREGRSLFHWLWNTWFSVFFLWLIFSFVFSRRFSVFLYHFLFSFFFLFLLF
jgi:hypothetical protein